MSQGVEFYMVCRAKQIDFEFIRFDGDNITDVENFVGGKIESVFQNWSKYVLLLSTSNGGIQMSIGDYILKKSNGDIYVCKSELFSAIFEIIVEKV